MRARIYPTICPNAIILTKACRAVVTTMNGLLLWSEYVQPLKCFLLSLPRCLHVCNER